MAIEKVFISILVPILRGDIFEELTKFYAYCIQNWNTIFHFGSSVTQKWNFGFCCRDIFAHENHEIASLMV